MSEYFRAVAIDFDGTLTEGGRPHADVLEALADVRRSGRKLALVTGRVIDELRGVFPDFEEWFDVVVAENGAVLHRGGVSRGLSSPVPLELDRRLVHRSIPFQRGQILLACDARYELAVFEELRRLGSDCQLVRNRQALMVLPAGVTKASGLFEAFGELGLSHHSAIGIGDAENDLAMLELCEVGVAVSNAVEAVKQRADVVLSDPAGRGVARLLRGPLLAGELVVEPRRWQVELGLASDGSPVRLPASQVSVLVTGGSGAGKSYAAGLLAERLIQLGYSVCVFDPEGDHGPLGRLRGVISVGGRGALPLADELPRLLQHRLGSLVVDLSQSPPEQRESYLGQALEALRGQRAVAGVPHWIIVDEAHVPLHAGTEACQSFAPEQKGFCLVTWRPDELCPGAKTAFDFALVLTGEKGLEPDALAFIERMAGLPDPRLQRTLARLEFGQGVLLRLGARPEIRVLSLGPRWVRHVRHWHKYVTAEVPAELRFQFRSDQALTGASAGNLAELHREIGLCRDDVLGHHLQHGDLSKWVEQIVQDRRLAEAFRRVEQRAGARTAPVQTLRRELREAIEARYLE